MRCYLRRCALAALVVALGCSPSSGQQPIDIFPDDRPLSTGFIRLASWNLRHINLENGARQFLPGANDAEDFAILTATFARAIRDLGVDLIAIQEHQPRAGEPNRLLQIRDHLNAGSAGTWRTDETAIPYDDPSNPFGNLQFGLLWNSSKVTIDSNADILLEQLRQPRDPTGKLTERTMRIPWLVPVQAGPFAFDLMVLHLKSGGDTPQAAEVNALEHFIKQRQTASPARHLVVCGDWNIRPDQSSGRSRLRQLMVPSPGGNLMRVLTMERPRLTLDDWDTLGPLPGGSPLALLVPFSHFNAAPTLDTFLDHMAISSTLDEVFDDPIQVTMEDGASDLHPGIRVAMPLIPESSYVSLTDHLPLVLTLRTAAVPVPPAPTGGLRIAAAIPNPVGDDVQDEEVHITNTAGQAVPLAGWKIGDSTGTSFWTLQTSDGTAQPGNTTVVRRKGRPMSLNNTGDSIVLVNPAGTTVDQKTYGTAASGQVFTFN